MAGRKTSKRKSSRKTTWASWQRNPNILETKKVQVWTRTGIMLRVIGLKDAREMVREGHAVVITPQAIMKLR